MTTPDFKQALTPQPDVTLGASQSGAIAGIDDSKSFQRIDGFGAALTDSSTYLLGTQLPAAAQKQVLTSLFSKGNGIGLSFMRISLGSSDFTATPAAAPSTYSYDDNKGAADPNLAQFSTAHDWPYTIPLIREAQAINPALKFFGSPWSPPGWMKTDSSMLGTANNIQGQLNTAYYGTLANYFVRFISDYKANGIDIWAVTPQNEPTNPVGTYSGMLFPAVAEANFITANLKPALTAAGLQTRILGGDDVGVNVDYAKTLLANAGSAMAGTAWHCYANDLYRMTTIASANPALPLYMTECSTGSTGISPLNAAQTIMESTHFGASAAVLWNLALDPNGGPKMGQGCNGCTGLVTVDPAKQTATATINFYQIGHFSKYVDPGAVLVQEIDGNHGIWDQAYRNPDGSEVLVLYNATNGTQTFGVQWNQAGGFGYTLAAGATATFFTRADTSQPTRSLAVGSAIKLAAASWPAYLARHQNFLGYIAPIGVNSGALDKADASFIVRQGRGKPSCYSFESLNYPGYFLQHENFRIKLKSGDTGAASLNGTTFCPSAPLNGNTDPTYVSLESLDWPGYFIEHQNFALNLVQNDGSPGFAADATFGASIPGPVVGTLASFQPINQPGTLIRHYAFTFYTAQIGPNNPAIDKKDSSFVIRAGLGNASCISIESTNYPGYFVRPQNGQVKLLANDNSTAAKNDGTFCPTAALNGSSDLSVVSLQSLSQQGYFIRQQNGALVLAKNDGSAALASDASFKLVVPVP